MKILLDTHILLWAITNDPRLPEKARELIVNVENDLYYSLISLWEVELKHLSHPDAMPLTAKELAGYCEQSGFQSVLIREKHIFALEKLTREEAALPHKDPFDKILICQASMDKMLFVTHDSLLAGYRDDCILSV